MRINAVRTPILVFAALTAVFVPLMTSSNAALGLGTAGAASASPSAADSGSASAPAALAPVHTRHHPHRPAAPSATAEGAFYRSVLDLRPDLGGLSDRQYYYIGQAFCTSAELGDDQLGQIQQAYALPAATLAYDTSMADMILQTAPMEFVQENQVAFGFDGSDIDSGTLNNFRRKLCADHPLWRSYASFVRAQLESLGPWQTDPSYNAPGQSAQLWNDDLAAWESALGPWLPRAMQNASADS